MRLLHANGAPGEHAPSLYAARAGEAARVPRPRLERDAEVETCIVGAGLAGLSAALHLAEAGREALVLEAHRAGWGASGRNGGQLGSGFNRSPDALAAMIGAEGARAAWDFAEGAKRLVLELLSAHGIEAHPRPGIVYAAHRARLVAGLHAEARRLRDAWGYEAGEILSREALLARVASPDYHGGTLDAGAWHLDPLALALGLARAAEAAGARLCERTEALRIERAPGPAGAWHVVTPRARVRARRVLVACNGYLDDLVPGVGRHVMPINSFVVATEPLGDRLRALLPKDDAVADTRFVIDYFRRSDDGRLVFGGGESYGYRFPGNPARLVRRALVRTFPTLADARVEHAWGGTLAITRHRLPCVREPRTGLHVMGGWSGHGLALATAGGRAFARAALGDAAGLRLLESLPAPAFPGGTRSRALLQRGAMTGAAWLDRL